MPEKRDGPLKVRLRVEVPVAARRFIALRFPSRTHTARKHLARRETIQLYVQARLDMLTELLPFWEDEPPPDSELRETRDAIDYLKKAGWPAAQIHGWILMQRARLGPLRTLVPTFPPKEKL